MTHAPTWSGDQPCFIITLTVFHFFMTQQLTQCNNYSQNANEIAILFHNTTDTTICTMQQLSRCGVPNNLHNTINQAGVVRNQCHHHHHH